MRNIAKYIEHTLLKADTTRQMIDQHIEEAKQYPFASICVSPYWVNYCHNALKDFEVNICTVIGFPLGAQTTNVKVFETKQAVKDGATEIDMVLNIGMLKSKEDKIVENDIKQVVNATKGKALVKVIIETCLLNDEEKTRACHIASQAGAHFVKTSTGFSTDGAHVVDIKLMKRVVGRKLGVKASGGIRTLDDALAMINAGATRIGASNSMRIVNEQ